MGVDDGDHGLAPRPREGDDAVALPGMPPGVDRDEAGRSRQDHRVAVGPAVGEHRARQQKRFRGDLARARRCGRGWPGLSEGQGGHQERQSHDGDERSSPPPPVRHTA